MHFPPNWRRHSSGMTIALTICLLVGGCIFADKEKSGPRAAEAEPATFDVLPDRVGAAYCARLFGCCSTAERQGHDSSSPSVDFGADSEEACANAYAQALRTDLLARLIEADKEGRIAYDPDAMADCLADFRERSCSTIPSKK